MHLANKAHVGGPLHQHITVGDAGLPQALAALGLEFRENGIHGVVEGGEISTGCERTSSKDSGAARAERRGGARGRRHDHLAHAEHPGHVGGMCGSRPPNPTMA